MSSLDRQQVHPNALRRAVTAQRAVELRLAGRSYRSIARRLAKSESWVRELVRWSFEEANAHRVADAAQLRELENRRLDRIWEALWPNRGDLRVANVLVTISRRRAAMNGLDQPPAAADQVDAFAAQDNYNYDQLSLEELQTMETLMLKAKVIGGAPGDDAS
jgi:predicted DsbA family dithiol-disulfide isomerase